ncbi:BrnT family toxin [Thermopetrobacter sp. TC1]|uniref:BrnT family toxin n=1 Tax=Thermopetrobacter sp. TC1 TaxID=1495045 RepID=UPI001E30EC9F|nr:BrnT family toxin [Thermopetrobacter sp. TC1]
MVAHTKKDYGERRFRAVGRIEGLPYMVVFTPRGTRLRIISMRRMHEKEARKYGI